MTRQHYGDHIRRTQNHWRQHKPQKPRPGLVPFEEYKKQEEAKASPPKARPVEQQKASKLYTARDLQWMEFPPLRFIGPGYLVEG